MSYFKRLTESRQLAMAPDVRQFAASTDREEGSADDFSEFPQGSSVRQPYRSFKMHSHQLMFRRNPLLLASTFKERMQRLGSMVPKMVASSPSARYEKLDRELSKCSRQERRQRDAHTLAQTASHSLPNEPKIVFSHNTSPIKQVAFEQSSSMHASMKMSEQFFTQFLKLMEKLTDERKEKQPETVPNNPPACHQKCECHHEMQQRCLNATQICSNTPSHQHTLNSLQSPYAFREYSAPQNYDCNKQPPIIINNIIKPEERRSHWNERFCHEEDNYGRRERSTIDDKLEQQEIVIKKLESERRAHTSFNQTLKLNSIGKHSISNANESQHDSFRPTPMGKTAPLSKELTYQARDSSMTCLDDDNCSENELIREIRREEEASKHYSKPIPSTSEDSEQSIEQQVSSKKRTREFSMVRRQNSAVAQPPLPPNSSNKKTKQEDAQRAKEKEVPPVILEDYEVKPPVSFDFPMSKGSQQLTLAEAFQMRRGDMFSREKTKRDKSKPDKTKQELAQLRKEMMKRRPKEEPTPPSQNIQVCSEKQSRVLRDASNTSSCKREPSRDLIDRLIGGVKVKVEEREMKALTTKNYNDLPEVKQKRKQQRQREEFAQRMQAKKEFEKSLRIRH